MAEDWDPSTLYIVSTENRLIPCVVRFFCSCFYLRTLPLLFGVDFQWAKKSEELTFDLPICALTIGHISMTELEYPSCWEKKHNVKLFILNNHSAGDKTEDRISSQLFNTCCMWRNLWTTARIHLNIAQFRPYGYQLYMQTYCILTFHGFAEQERTCRLQE